MKLFIILTALMIFLFILLVVGLQKDGFGEEIGIASWYSTKENKRIMANGEVFDDTKFTAASWDYKLGTTLQVYNTANGKRCLVVVTDRGPAKRLYRMGRIIDLSKRAFSEIACLEQGLVEVQIKEIK